MERIKIPLNATNIKQDFRGDSSAFIQREYKTSLLIRHRILVSRPLIPQMTEPIDLFFSSQNNEDVVQLEGVIRGRIEEHFAVFFLFNSQDSETCFAWNLRFS